nr:hypothetical protein [Staphylococcus aureus]
MRSSSDIQQAKRNKCI